MHSYGTLVARLAAFSLLCWAGIDPAFAQLDITTERYDTARLGANLLLDWKVGLNEREKKLPRLPAFVARDGTRADYGTKDLRAGITLELWIEVNPGAGEAILATNRAPDGRGAIVRRGRARGAP